MSRYLSGHVLTASPAMDDPNFARTVVLLVTHDKHGAFGIVLNRLSGRMLQEVWRQVSSEPCQLEQPLHVGGPVQGPLVALHTREDLSETEVLPGLHLSASGDSLTRLVSNPESAFHVPCRMFSGYCGWGEGQLEDELKAGAWLTAPATMDYVFFPEGDDLWQKVAKDIADGVLFSSLKIKHKPRDPSLN